MYEFHYLDENHKLLSFELYSTANPYKGHDCHSWLSGSTAVSLPVSKVVEEEVEEDVAAACSNKSDDA